MFYFLSKSKEHIFCTDYLSLKSILMHSHFPPSSEISWLKLSNKSLLTSIISRRHLYNEVISKTIYFPMPVHAPVITTRLLLSSLTGFFLISTRVKIWMAITRMTIAEVIYWKMLKINDMSIIYNIIS